jgi:DNA invertase Pin-like site-specific DNA recombinase
VDAAQITSLRAVGQSWRTIARETKLSVGTVYAAAQKASVPGFTAASK